VRAERRQEKRKGRKERGAENRAARADPAPGINLSEEALERAKGLKEASRASPNWVAGKALRMRASCPARVPKPGHKTVQNPEWARRVERVKVREEKELPLERRVRLNRRVELNLLVGRRQRRVRLNRRVELNLLAGPRQVGEKARNTPLPRGRV
jgi:hypothetical protein